jgi:hypothetical protein
VRNTTDARRQSFTIISTLLATLLEFLSLILLHRAGLNYIPSGPSTLIFSIIYQHHRIVPSAYNFRIFGLPLTNKSFTYIFALQVCLFLLFRNTFQTYILPARHWTSSRVRSCSAHRHLHWPDIPLRPSQPQRIPDPSMASILRIPVYSSSDRLPPSCTTLQPRAPGRVSRFQCSTPAER